MPNANIGPCVGLFSGFLRPSCEKAELSSSPVTLLIQVPHRTLPRLRNRLNLEQDFHVLVKILNKTIRFPGPAHGSWARNEEQYQGKFFGTEFGHSSIFQDCEVFRDWETSHWKIFSSS